MTDGFLVIDASVAVKAIFPNPMRAHCMALVETFTEVQPAAPVLWAYETTSAITKAVYFGEITEKEARQALDKLDGLGVHLFIADREQNQAAFDWTLRLKRGSAYDSYYLSLAQTLECDLWTADKRLFNAVHGSRPGWLHWVEELTP